MENDLLERIKTLEKELKQLKKEFSESKKDNLTMFGRTYSQVGDIKSDLVLNTRGQVKIRIGGKFIDLLKNGEINVDTDIIFTTNDSDNLGSKNGLYILDDGSVYLKYKDKQINLVGELGTTYVSFKDTQETSSEEKLQALHNIGFYYESLESLSETSIQNGLVFIESDQSLYVVKDGVGTKFISVIQETVNSILEEKQEEIEEPELPFKVENNRIVFSNSLLLDSANSRNAIKDDSGFYLYKDSEGNMVIEIDKLTVHSENPYKMHIDPKYWNKDCNFIVNASKELNENFEDETIELDDSFYIELSFPNQYEIGDILKVCSFDIDEDEIPSFPQEIELIIQEINKNTLQVSCNIEETAIDNLRNRMVRKKENEEVDPFQNLIVLCKPDSIPEGWELCGLPNIEHENEDGSTEVLAVYITKV